MNGKGPGLDDEIQLETVNHKGRTAALFALVAGALIWAAMWVTSTPRRWIAALVAIACGVGLYMALR